MSSELQLTRSGDLPGSNFMAEKLVVFVFAGILGTMAYHLATASVLHWMLVRSDNPFTWWYVPLIVIPALLLLGLAWVMGFGRRGSNWWGNCGAVAVTAAIVFCTIGAPYNCWNEFCF
jgi:uncharacterized BrkB/YihY/UPF0761 family membrane protein